MSKEKLSITTINPDGKKEEQEVLMSFALLNSLVRVVGDPTKAAMIGLDPDLAQIILITILIPRSPTGKPKVSFDEFELPGLEVEESYKIIDWAKEHVLDFFVKRLRAGLESLDQRKDDLKELGNSLAGMNPSLSNNSSS